MQTKLKIKPKVDTRQTLNREARASHHINIIGHYDDETLIDQDGKLIKLFSLSGINAVTKLQLTLDVLKRRRNSLFKTFNSHYALYAWIVRGKTTEFPEGKFTQEFSKQLNQKYKREIKERKMFHNRLYLALVTKPPANLMGNWVKRLSLAVDKAAKETYLKKTLEELTQVTYHFCSALSEYDIKPLTVLRQEGKNPLSESLQFIGQLLNLEELPVRLSKTDAAQALPRHRLFFNDRSGLIEARAADGSKRFAVMLSLKNYTGLTYAGMLDGLSHLPIEFVLTQSFRFFDPNAAKTTLKQQQKDFEQSKDESLSQTNQIDESLDDAASGEAGFGHHHLTVCCLANDPQKLNSAIAEVIAAFLKLDMVCVREDIAGEAAFWAQLPGNFAYIAREATISTKNLASFVSLHQDPIGTLKGNFWGDAVTVLETPSGSPYYFNFHHKDVGNCLVFGSMGSGKTTLIGFLLAQSLKFGGRRIVFDKDRGLEILVRALGGTYEILTPGIPTGFNPCQLADTPQNRQFLFAFFKRILTTAHNLLEIWDEEIISKVIQGIYTLPLCNRQFQHIAHFFGAKSKGSLRARFDPWHSGGEHAWLFDNQNDTLNLKADVIGFEMGNILNSPETKTPASMYLMHRVTQFLEGQRGGIFMDEGWKILEDEYFEKVINDLSRTPRKKNNFLVLSTQIAEDAVECKNSKALEASAACKIIFPNPAASTETYRDKLGLTAREFELIKTLDNDQRFFLLNVGHGKESVVVRVNLKGLDDEIAVISGRESTVKLLDDIRKEVGDDLQSWLPLFHERRKHLC